MVPGVVVARDLRVLQVNVIAGVSLCAACALCMIPNTYRSIMAKLSGRTFGLFHQLRLSIEHSEVVSINSPPHSEACFCFKLGLQ